MKKGLHTSEFIITVITVIGSISASVANLLDPKWEAIATALSVFAYNVSRGLAKSSQNE